MRDVELLLFLVLLNDVWKLTLVMHLKAFDFVLEHVLIERGLNMLGLIACENLFHLVVCNFLVKHIATKLVTFGPRTIPMLEHRTTHNAIGLGR